MNKTIQVCYKWRVEEMLLLNKLHMRYSADGRKMRRRINFAGAAFLLLSLLSLIQSASRGSALPFALCATGILIAVPLFTSRAVRKAYARKPDRDLPITYELSEERLISRTEIATVESPWRAVQSAIRTPKGFLLYLSERQLHWLPIHGFSNPEEVEQFADFARTNIKDFSTVGGNKSNLKTI